MGLLCLFKGGDVVSDNTSSIKDVNRHPCYDIVEVYHTRYEKDVNERLASGWRLLETFTTCYDPEVFYKHQGVHYVLGRPRTIEPFNNEESKRYGTYL